MTDQEKKPDNYVLLQGSGDHVEISVDVQDDDNKSSKGSKIFKEFTNRHFKHRKEKSSDDDFYVEKYGIKRIELINPEREVYLLLDGADVTVFLEMQEWIKNNPHKSLKQTINEFEKKPNADKADAFAKILYDQPFPDFILKYSNNEDEKDLLPNTKRRFKFERLLLEAGLVVEHEEDMYSENTYVKIWTPFYRLCEEAHRMRLKLPLDVSRMKEFEWLEERHSFLSKLTSHFSRNIDLQKESAFFKKDKLRQYKGAELDKDFGEIALNFWSGAKRNYVTHHIIITANQVKMKKSPQDENPIYIKHRIRSLAIKALLKDDVYTGFFTLHDGPVKPRTITYPENLRSKLFRTWVKSHGSQPLQEIREYFGEKMGLYFAWLGFYTTWLTIPGILGFITVIYGLIAAAIENDFTKGINGISTIWDNALSFPYALAMSIWATCFLETWKRFNAALVYDWDTSDFEREEQPRPEFKGTVIRKSPITSKKEITFPLREKLKKLLISSTIVFVSICIVTVTIGMLTNVLRLNIGVLSNVVASLVNLATVLILNLLYEKLAVWLTDYENHRTSTGYEGKAAPFHNNADVCQFHSCMVELTIQLAIILIGKQGISQIQEIFVPWITSRMHRDVLKQDLEKLKEVYKSASRKSKKIPQWIYDIVQFGFISLFATAFPLAPFFAWIHNVTEIRSDAFKYITTLQRPVGFQAQDLGMWEKILHFVSLLAVITNATIIAFQSSYMRGIFEHFHFVFFIKILFAYAIPDVPKSVRIAIERERYLTRLALEGEEPAADEFLDETETAEKMFDNKKKTIKYLNNEQNKALKENEM
ncbi:6280_t:CDS:10 [Ambispora leptoticha]|uniref:6280_t:CDS:1 n=1 Tax=Ambispora leptoticha TaxID=144679 RepID=A0A9N9EYK9_9GLOM|nr:6280_t:CDS:10 [Ambispora leptoticha]